MVLSIEHLKWSHITVINSMLRKFPTIDKPWLYFLRETTAYLWFMVNGKGHAPVTSIYLKNVKCWVTSAIFEKCEVLGDECHFLFLCKRLKVLRWKYISRYFLTKPCMNKFVEHLSSEHSETINNLGFWTWIVCKFMNKNLSECSDVTILYRSNTCLLHAALL